MARLHSSLGDRTVYTAAGLAKAQGFAAKVYEDPAGTILANLAVYDPTNAAVPGGAVPGAALVVDAFSNRPAFWDLNDREVLYITVAGGPLEPIRPDAQPQVTALAMRVGTVEGVAAAAETPAGAQAKADAAAASAAATQLKTLDVDSIYHFGHSYVIGGALAAPVGGWSGTCTLTAGSTTVGSASTIDGTAAVGDIVEGRGIVPGTTVVTIDVSNRPATLSAPATLSITGAAISTGAVIAARFGTRVARALHANTTVNLGVSGSQAWLQGAAQGGFSTVYQAITQVRNSAPYLATLAAATLFTGVNDLRAYDNLPLLKHALRVMVSRIRCAAVFEESHSSVAFTAGTWTDQVNASAFMSGGAGKVCSTPATGVITLTMPADIPANSTISIFHAIVGDQQTFRTDGVYRYQRSGTTLATMDLRNLVGTSSNFGAVCQRLTGINPGDVISVDWPTPPPGGKVYFDCWVLEAPAPPLVLVCKQPKAIDYLSPAVAVTDQRVSDFNTMLDALAGEFGPAVVTVDLSAMDHNPSVFSSDGLHPNVAGHGVIADAVLAAIRSNASRIPAASSVMTTRRY